VSVRVLAIVGAGRSGSTMIGNILGSVDGVFCGGEIRYLWERGLRDDRLCGCGEAFHDCPTWSAILARAGCDPHPADVEHLIAGAADGTRVRHVPRLLAGQRWGWPPRLQPNGYREQLQRLYHAIPGVTGCSLLVDTSKLPTYTHVLEELGGVELFVVHLVRDPRATAYSWGRHKPLADGARAATMQRQSPGRSAMLWNVWNITARQLWQEDPDHYLRVDYEEFVLRPQECIDGILRFAGHHSDAARIFKDGRTVALGVNHTVAGNPDRLQRGDVRLRLDDEWTRKMSRSDRLMVTALTAPVRAHL
jgi:sulfotransferase family protein